MSTHRYTKLQVQRAVKNSFSLRQVLKQLDVIPAGGNYSVLKKFIQEHNIPTDHFKGQGWNLGRKFTVHPLEDYLTNKRSITSHKLRIKLLNAGTFQHKCSVCKLQTWLDKPIPLELDHIDGNHANNTLSNLRLLCPNCHSTTPTFRRSKSSLKA